MPVAPIEVSYANFAAAILIQFPLMLLLPVALGLLVRRRLDVGMSVWVLGGVTFVASQVVHLPLNWALGLLGPPRGVALWPLPLVGLTAGLSAGLCEELARYTSMRWLLKQRRDWPGGVQFGAGHGGMEAILIGLLALGSFASVLIAPWAAVFGVPEDQRAMVRHAARGYWALPWYLPVLAGWERVCAIAFHVGASVLVMRAVTHRRLVWLVLAIALHTLLNAPLVYAAHLGPPLLYGFLTLFAAGMVFMTFRLRADGPALTPRGSGKE